MQKLTPLERARSYFHADVGEGEIFFMNSQFIPRALVPTCQWTKLPVVACDCPEHLGITEKAA